MGGKTMPKGIQNKSYTGEFKHKAVETMQAKHLSYSKERDSLVYAIITEQHHGSESA